MQKVMLVNFDFSKGDEIVVRCLKLRIKIKSRTLKRLIKEFKEKTKYENYKQLNFYKLDV